jgi:hypothetical protein
LTRYALTLNGRITTELKALPGGSIEDQLAERLALLDGRDRFALLLWRLPDGVPFDLVDLDSEPTEYIQCAGGVSGRFTCEIRRNGPDGGPSHEVIGRPTGVKPSGALDETIHWADTETSVRENEVFESPELFELFKSYLDTGELPSSYETRQLPL